MTREQWRSIPLHIRCTERNKIDDRYPMDDAQWWKRQEVAAKRETIGSESVSARIPDVVAEWYCTQTGNPVWITAETIAAHYGLTAKQFQQAMRNYRRYGTLRQPLPSFYSGEMTDAEAAKDPYLQEVT